MKIIIIHCKLLFKSRNMRLPLKDIIMSKSIFKMYIFKIKINVALHFDQ